MSYTDEIDVLTLFRQSPVPPVLVQEWEGISQVVNNHTHWHEVLGETVTLNWAATQTFTMGSGPKASDPNYAIGIKVLWSSPLDPGPLFRTGYMQTLPTPSPANPSGNIDIIEAPLQTFTPAMIGTSLPALPLVLDPMNTVTALPVPTVVPGAVNVIAAGTSTGFSGTRLPSPVAFTYTAPLSVAPSLRMDDSGPPTEVVEVTANQAASTLSFSSSGSWTSALEAFLGNLLAGALMPKVTQMVSAALTSMLSTRAIAAAATLVAGGTSGAPTTLPPGVVLSATRVQIGTVNGVLGVHAVPALGMFGPLQKTLFPSGTGGTGSRCPLRMVAARAGTSTPIRVHTFRSLRDRVLLSGEEGMRLVGLYYRHAAEVTRILAAGPGQVERAAAALSRLQADLERGEPPGAEAVAALRGFLLGLLPHSSAALRADLGRVLEIPAPQVT